ncbi:interleukin-13 receptor subunit alpha-2 isoform X2 [Stegastes partitus]|uniref:Interleukin-13 receptor subunit alpha-2 isoform X2 n=1 Tax=Stegastes partitus TaxID=144197 RepID=A0A9Y4MTN6_9TELE|nr:PREDICTED: interleukin-13 receptor subunit alpha-2-like isoform X2 [Stegastes partitus]
MAIKTCLTHLMLLLIIWKESLTCNGLTVDPPENLTVLDPGHLGHLQISWSPPGSLINMTNCSIVYHLEYFNTYRNSWSMTRMNVRSYTAQFDLMKDIKVRVYTILDGPCTNNTMIQSRSYAELIQKPPSTGVMDTEVQNFTCVYHNKEHVECMWRRNPNTPAISKQNLYFWHKKLDQAVECPKYMVSGGVRRGCNFTGTSLPEFANIIFCVNGSSPEGPLKQTFVSLQIQNLMKPATTKKLHLQTCPDKKLQLQWERPNGKIPGHCLEWEVEHNQEGPDGKISKTQSVTRETNFNFTLPSAHNSERNCFRVRSKLHKYCADKSFWSDWSRPTCDPVSTTSCHEPQQLYGSPTGRP